MLEVRWQIHANLAKWEGALDIASALVNLAPAWPDNWIFKASSLVELNRLEEAHETLVLAAVVFPTDAIILYDLACVCCAKKRLEEARAWLAKAVDAGGSKIKLRALDDPDLEPLWKGTGA